MRFWKKFSYRRKREVIFSVSLIMMIGIGVVLVWHWKFLFDPRQSTKENVDALIHRSMQACFESEGSHRCYRDAADAFLGLLAPKEIMASLEEQEAYPEIFSRCHEVTHYVGRVAYAKTKSVALAYDQCAPACHGGCYHGVIEEYLKEKNVTIGKEGESNAPLAHAIINLCGAENDYAAPRIYWECLHGIGHALMFVTDSDLPRSLHVCDTLGERQRRETCYSGVFMENSSGSTNIDHPSRYLDPKNPMYPCTVLDQKYLNLCYQYQSSYFAETTHWQWEQTIELCNRVPVDYREGCFHIIGTNQVGYTQDNHVRKHTCDLIADPRFQEACIAGVASALGGRYVGKPEQMMAFCALVNEQNKKVCYQQMGNALSSWGDDAAMRRNICGQIKDPGSADWCLSRESAMTEPSFR